LQTCNSRLRCDIEQPCQPKQKNAGTTKAEECRKKAEEAEDMAAKVGDVQARETYLEIARTWREMAEQAERNRYV